MSDITLGWVVRTFYALMFVELIVFYVSLCRERRRQRERSEAFERRLREMETPDA